MLTWVTYSSLCLISVYSNGAAVDLDTSLLKRHRSSLKPSACPCLMTYKEPSSKSKANRAKLPFIIQEKFHHNTSLFFASLMFAYRFQDESEKIDYQAFLSSINWRENPAPAVLPDVTVKVSLKWMTVKKTVICSIIKHIFWDVILWLLLKQPHVHESVCVRVQALVSCGPHKLWAPPCLISSKSALGKTHSTTTLK